MACFLRPEDVVYVEDVIAVIIIVSVILDAFTRLGENAPGIMLTGIMSGGFADRWFCARLYRRQVRRCGNKLRWVGGEYFPPVFEVSILCVRLCVFVKHFARSIAVFGFWRIALRVYVFFRRLCDRTTS